MSTETTETPRTLAQQALAAEAVVGLTQMFGHLPAPFLTIHTVYTAAVDLQLDTPQEFETWRTALQIAPDTVTLHVFQGSTWLGAEGVFRGVQLHLTGHNLPLTVVQAASARDGQTVSV